MRGLRQTHGQPSGVYAPARRLAAGDGPPNFYGMGLSLDILGERR